LTTRRLVTLLAVLAILAMATRVSLDSDTWWHLRAGQWMIEHGALLRADPFSFTRLGAAWHYPGWLAQVVLYAVYRAAGPGGLNLLTALVVTLAFIFVYKTMRGDAFLRSFVLILAAAASAVYWSARPQIFSLLLGAAFYWGIESYRRGERNRLWLLPVLMALWVNLHGGFAIGFILLGLSVLGLALEGLFASGEERRRAWRSAVMLGGVGLICALAVGLNPFGFEMLAYPFKTVGIGALQSYIQEWQSPDFHTREAQPFLWLLFATLAAIGFSRRRMSMADFVVLSGVAYTGFLAGRNMPLLSIVAPPILVSHAQEILDRLAPAWGASVPSRPASARIAWINYSVAALTVAAVVLKALPVLRADISGQEISKTQPLESIAYMREHGGLGNMLNSYNWGGYLIWALPQYPVFVDGRTDLYDDELLSQYLTAVRAEPGWRDVLQRWQIGVVLLEPNMPLVTVLSLEGWRTVAADHLSVVLVPPDQAP
jgi:hypothetical protein